jgi:hypothetical protein
VTVSLIVLMIALQAAAEPPCKMITISNPPPTPGYPRVSDTATVAGTAKLEPHLYFWVFAQNGQIDPKKPQGLWHGNPSTFASHTKEPGFSGDWTTEVAFVRTGELTNSIWTIRAMAVDAQNHEKLKTRFNRREGTDGVSLQDITPHCEATREVQTSTFVGGPEPEDIHRRSPPARTAPKPSGAPAKRSAACSDTQPIAEILAEAESYIANDSLAQALARYKCAHFRLPPEQQRIARDALPVTFWQDVLSNDDLVVTVDSARRVFRSPVMQ